MLQFLHCSFRDLINKDLEKYIAAFWGKYKTFRNFMKLTLSTMHLYQNVQDDMVSEFDCPRALMNKHNVWGQG